MGSTNPNAQTNIFFQSKLRNEIGPLGKIQLTITTSKSDPHMQNLPLNDKHAVILLDFMNPQNRVRSRTILHFPVDSFSKFFLQHLIKFKIC